MGDKIINLRTPIKVGGTEIKSLFMREPTFDDNAVVEKIPSQLQRERVMFANLCNVTPEEIGRLSLHDAKQLAEAFNDFL